MAVRKNKKPLLVKFSEGSTTGSAEKSKLSDWTIIYYTRDSLSGGFKKEVYGIDGNFDLVVIFENNNLTKRIAEDTLFLIGEYPTELNSQGNYIVKRIVHHDDGEIVVGLTHRTNLNYKNIYYNRDGVVYSYKINFDSATMKGYVNKYVNLPFGVGSILWLYEPIDISDTENRIVVNSIQTTGIVENLKIFNQISFGEYNGN